MPDENKPVINPQPPPVLPVIPPMAHDASISPPPPVVERKKNQGVDIPPVVTTSKKGGKKSKGKMIVTILGLFVLVGGIAAGVILVQRQQDIRERASAICSGTCTPNDTNCGGDNQGCCVKSNCEYYCDSGITQSGADCEGEGGCDCDAPPPGNGNGNGDTCTNPTCTSVTSDSSSGCLSATSCNLCNADDWAVQRNYCRGPKTNGNCQKCVRCNPGRPLNCDLGCSCPGANPNTCYDHGDYYTTGNDPGRVCATLDCGNTQVDVGYIDNDNDPPYTYLYSATWSDGKDWSECEETPPEETASCVSCTVYDEDWEEVDLTDINIGQTVYFATLGSSNPDGLITKARFKINGTADDSWCDVANLASNDWCEITQKHDTYGYYVQYTIPSASSYRVTSAVYAGEDLGWVPPEPPPRR